MILSPDQLKELRKVIKELGLNFKVQKTIGDGFWIDECGSSVPGFIEWLIKQEGKDEIRRSVAKYGLLLEKFEIDTITESAYLLNYYPYCEYKWVPKSAIIIVNGNSVVPYSALK